MLARERHWDSVAGLVETFTELLKTARNDEDLSDANARVKSRLDDLRTELNEWPGMTSYVPTIRTQVGNRIVEVEVTADDSDGD
jgi:hypothetical protein